MRSQRAGTGLKLAALVAPLMAWMAPAAASPDQAPPTDVVGTPAASPPEVAASPELAGSPPEVAASPELAGSPFEVAASPDAPDVASPEMPADDATAPEVPPPASSPDAPAPSTATGSPETLAAPGVAGSPMALASTATVHAAASSGIPWIGAMADIGVPDGATVSIVVRPIPSLRAHAGFSHNLISLGERVGLTWAPLAWWASPTLSLDYGHYADGNANPLVRAATGDAMFSSAVLERVGYDYASAHLGIELGRQWFTFYLHAGVSRITTTIHNLSAETMSESAGTTSITFSKDPSVQLTTVSARLGFIVYLAK
jgi:hypothetical protein